MAISLSEETRAALQRISTATITLQLLKRGVRNVYMRGVAPLAPPSERLVGVATTLRFIPMREHMSTPDILADRENPQRVAIDTIEPGAILVIDARGVSDCAALGDILAERIKQRVVVVVVVIPAALADEVARDGVDQEEIEDFIKRQVEKGRPVIGLYPPDEKTAPNSRNGSPPENRDRSSLLAPFRLAAAGCAHRAGSLCQTFGGREIEDVVL